jgi:hypothetical protein
VLVSAIIGGLVTALFIFVAMSGLEDGSDDVTIKEAPLPEKASSETVFDNDMSSSVREVYMRDGPGVVSVDVASSELGPGGGSGFVLDEEATSSPTSTSWRGRMRSRSGSPAGRGRGPRSSAKTLRRTWRS